MDVVRYLIKVDCIEIIVIARHIPICIDWAVNLSYRWHLIVIIIRIYSIKHRIILWINCTHRAHMLIPCLSRISINIVASKRTGDELSIDISQVNTCFELSSLPQVWIIIPHTVLTEFNRLKLMFIFVRNSIVHDFSVIISIAQVRSVNNIFIPLLHILGYNVASSISLSNISLGLLIEVIFLTRWLA